MDQKQYITKASVRDMIMGWSGGFDYIEEPVEDALEDLRGIPTVDAVPVVRCKDCVYYTDAKFNLLSEHDMVCAYTTDFHYYREPDDYCSKGEQRR